MKTKNENTTTNGRNESKVDSSHTLKSILNLDLLEKSKNSWVYPLLMIFITFYGYTTISDIDEKKSQVDEKLVILENEIKTNLNQIRLQSTGLTSLNMQVGKNVMDLFQFTTNYNQQKINAINSNVLDAEEKLKGTHEKLIKFTVGYEKLNEGFNSQTEKVLLLREKIAKSNILEELKVLEKRVSNVRERLAHILGAIEKERRQAEVILTMIPNSNINPDYFKKPISSCIVREGVKVRSGPNTSYEVLTTLQKGKRVDQISHGDGGWIGIRYLTLVGYSDAQYYKCI